MVCIYKLHLHLHICICRQNVCVCVCVCVCASKYSVFSAPLMIPLRESDIPKNVVPFTFRNKPPFPEYSAACVCLPHCRRNTVCLVFNTEDQTHSLHPDGSAEGGGGESRGRSRSEKEEEERLAAEAAAAKEEADVPSTLEVVQGWARRHLRRAATPCRSSCPIALSSLPLDRRSDC